VRPDEPGQTLRKSPKRRTFTTKFSRARDVVLTGSADDMARLWDAETGALQTTLVEHAESVDCCAFSPDGTRVVTTSGATARLCDAEAGSRA
jgi:WD40 repeat protein